MRKSLLSVLALVLALGVFLAARYLDKTPVEREYEPLPTMVLEGYEPTLTEPVPPVEPENKTPETTETTAVPETEPAAEEAVPETTADAGTGEGEAEEPAQTDAEGEPLVTEPVETVPPYTGPGGESYVLTFAGDCTLGSNLNNAYNGYGFFKTIGEDMSYPFVNVSTYFENDEFSMVNLEGPLCVGGNPAANKQHVFRGNPEFVEILTGSGVEFASLANNHSQDYGNVGYAETKENLENAGISYVERDSSTIVTTENGLTIGIYGAVYYLMEADVIEQEISKLKRTGVDLVIFAPHWGNENSYTITDDQAYLAHVAIDAGADIVFGAHPHVLQPIEEYKHGVIFYSLGNFCFGGNIYPKDYDTALIQLEIIRNEDGSVSLGETTIIPACISSVENRNNYQPTLYEEGSEGYERVLKKLSGTFR